jgi:mannose-6-phosphate isomerase-like protein (cupin superfamily)
MESFSLPGLLAERQRSGRRYLEFLRISALSVGLYELPAGADDPQQPHGEDEVYYVVRGRARLRVGDHDRAVEPGTVLLVRADVPHRFHSITEDLTALVFFAPAEGSRAAGASGE